MQTKNKFKLLFSAYQQISSFGRKIELLSQRSGFQIMLMEASTNNPCGLSRPSLLGYKPTEHVGSWISTTYMYSVS